VSPIVTSNIDVAEAKLDRFTAMLPVNLALWGNSASDTVVDALRTLSPVGRRVDPRGQGPHMRTRILPEQTTFGDSVMLKFQTDVGLYPYYVIGGRSGGVTIESHSGGKLAWVGDTGSWRYARSVRQGPAAANPFNRLAWEQAQGPVQTELVAQLSTGLD